MQPCTLEEDINKMQITVAGFRYVKLGRGRGIMEPDMSYNPYSIPTQIYDLVSHFPLQSNVGAIE